MLFVVIGHGMSHYMILTPFFSALPLSLLQVGSRLRPRGDPKKRVKCWSLRLLSQWTVTHHRDLPSLRLKGPINQIITASQSKWPSCIWKARWSIWINLVTCFRTKALAPIPLFALINWLTSMCLHVSVYPNLKSSSTQFAYIICRFCATKQLCDNGI